MQNLVAPLQKLSVRQWGVLFAVLATMAVGTALISQYVFGMHPCKLCIFQRWPFAAAIVLSLGLVAFHRSRYLVPVLFVLLALVFWGNAGLAFFHMGVEYKWWPYHSDCTASAIKAGASVAEMLAALQAAPLVRCDERVPFLFGMTMAFYNVLTCFVLGTLAWIALYTTRQRSNSLSQ